MIIFPELPGVEINLYLLVFTGLGAGIVSGFAGVGGGFFMTPALIILGFPANIAVGTSLAWVVGNCVVGAFRHGRQGNVDIKLGLVMIAAAMAGMEIGVRILNWITRMGLADEGVLSIAIVVLMIVGTYTLMESVRRKRQLDRILKRGEIAPPMGAPPLAQRIQRIKLPPMVHFSGARITISIWIVVAIGLITGMLAGVMGVGGGGVDRENHIIETRRQGLGRNDYSDRLVHAGVPFSGQKRLGDHVSFQLPRAAKRTILSEREKLDEVALAKNHVRPHPGKREHRAFHFLTVRAWDIAGHGITHQVCRASDDKQCDYQRNPSRSHEGNLHQMTLIERYPTPIGLHQAPVNAGEQASLRRTIAYPRSQKQLAHQAVIAGLRRPQRPSAVGRAHPIWIIRLSRGLTTISVSTRDGNGSRPSSSSIRGTKGAQRGHKGDRRIIS